MTPSQPTPQSSSRQDPTRWPRQDRAHAHADFQDPFHPSTSQRRYAQQHDIPRSTLGDWLREPAPDGVESEVVAFFRSPPGERCLGRLVLAAFTIFQQKGACGIRPVGAFLGLAGLDAFVGTSYGALHAFACWLQADLGTFGDEERPRLGALMPHRQIVLAGDEHFHAGPPCLVAVEPCSGFIVAEAYQPRRDAGSWTELIRGALQGLNVELLLLVSDQAKGLLACAQDGLQVAHGPDLFHQQRLFCGPVLLALARPIRCAQKELDDARARTARLEERFAKRQAPGPEDLAQHFDVVLESVREQLRAEQRLLQAHQRQEEAVRAVRTFGDDYHPFDRQTGQPVSQEQVRQRLEGHLGRLGRLAEAAGASAAAREALAKARVGLAALVACVAWFWQGVRQRVEGLQLSEQGERLVYERLLPGEYWQQQAPRARTAEERLRQRELATQLQAEAWSEGGALGALGQAEREAVQGVAQQCAGLFGRSSSCVEGRNGRLSLQHHGHGKLSPERLKAQTALHNYLPRADGTTAAERFFQVKPRDLFGWLLQRMPPLPRPAAKRPKQPDQHPVGPR